MSQRSNQAQLDFDSFKNCGGHHSLSLCPLPPSQPKLRSESYALDLQDEGTFIIQDTYAKMLHLHNPTITLNIYRVNISMLLVKTSGKNAGTRVLF